MDDERRPPDQAPPDEPVGEAPASATDPVLEAYKAGLDRTLIRENLRLTPEERGRKLVALARFARGLSEAGRRAREDDPDWGLRR
jgi:hypothetical protein